MLGGKRDAVALPVDQGWRSVLVCQRARAVRRGERCRAGRRRAERAMVSDKVSVEGAVDICRQRKWSRLARERAKGRHASIVCAKNVLRHHR